MLKSNGPIEKYFVFQTAFVTPSEMSFAQTGFRQLTRLFSTLSVTSVRTTNIGFLQTATRPQQLNSIRSSSTYDPYQQLEDPPEPFRHRGKDRIGNPYKIYQGGNICGVNFCGVLRSCGLWSAVPMKPIPVCLCFSIDVKGRNISLNISLFSFRQGLYPDQKESMPRRR